MSEAARNTLDWVQIETERWRKDYGGGVHGEVYAVAAGLYTGGTTSAWTKFNRALDTNYGGHQWGRVQACEAVDKLYAAEFAASIDGTGWRHVQPERWHKTYGGGVFGDVTVVRPGLFDGRLRRMQAPEFAVNLPDLMAGMDALCRAQAAVDSLHRGHATEEAR